MLKWISRELPLPFGAVSDNRRSLVYVDNLADLISVCIFHPRAANQTFLVSDDEDASTMQLIRQLADSLGAKCRLLHIPPKLLSFVGRTIGRKGIEKRLIASLQVDIEHTKNTLNWKPPYTMEYGLRETAQWYKTTKP
jgi:nucleoside-diphosphate-sugar epimerase